MPVSLALKSEEVRIRLTGPAALAALERELRFPLESVQAVSAGPFEEGRGVCSAPRSP